MDNGHSFVVAVSLYSPAVVRRHKVTDICSIMGSTELRAPSSSVYKTLKTLSLTRCAVTTDFNRLHPYRFLSSFSCDGRCLSRGNSELEFDLATRISLSVSIFHGDATSCRFGGSPTREAGTGVLSESDVLLGQFRVGQKLC